MANPFLPLPRTQQIVWTAADHQRVANYHYHEMTAATGAIREAHRTAHNRHSTLAARMRGTGKGTQIAPPPLTISETEFHARREVGS